MIDIGRTLHNEPNDSSSPSHPVPRYSVVARRLAVQIVVYVNPPGSYMHELQVGIQVSFLFCKKDSASALAAVEPCIAFCLTDLLAAASSQVNSSRQQNTMHITYFITLSY